MIYQEHSVTKKFVPTNSPDFDGSSFFLSVLALIDANETQSVHYGLNTFACNVSIVCAG